MTNAAAAPKQSHKAGNVYLRGGCSVFCYCNHPVVGTTWAGARLMSAGPSHRPRDPESGGDRMAWGLAHACKAFAPVSSPPHPPRAAGTAWLPGAWCSSHHDLNFLKKSVFPFQCCDILLKNKQSVDFHVTFDFCWNSCVFKPSVSKCTLRGLFQTQ